MVFYGKKKLIQKLNLSFLVHLGKREGRREGGKKEKETEKRE